jgi:hypothetical protein
MIRRCPLALGALLTMGWLAAASLAQAQEPYRVRGTLKSVTGEQLLLSTREGVVMGFELSPEVGIFVVSPASIEEIEPGDFIGLTTVSAGGRRVALEAHLFEEDLRGLGEGHYAWDLVEEPNMMTNATIAEVKETGGDRQIEVTYGTDEGQAAGVQSIYLPTGVPIVKMARTEDRGLLQPGRGVMLIVMPVRDLTPQVIAAVVGDGAIDPPM